MGCLVVPNFFAPKHPDFGFLGENAHAISYDRCNFNCRYCIFHFRRIHAEYREYTERSFKELVSRLMVKGEAFKFTGGEPTLSPVLLRDLQIVKELNGLVFLDTNGSNPDVVRDCCEAGYIDVLGVSFKGVDEKTALWMSGVNEEKCWHRVLDTLRLADFYRVRTIVTLVCFDDFSIEELSGFAELLSPYPSALIKLNAWVPDERLDGISKKPPSSGTIDKIVCEYIEMHPEMESRFILINDPKAVSSKDAIERR